MRKTNGKIVAASAMALASMALMACGGGSSDSISSIVPAPTPTPVVAARANAVTVVVVDAKTATPVAVPVTLKFGGQLAGKIADATNAVISGLVVSNGVASIYTDAKGTLEVTASATGYLAGGTSAYISAANAVITVELVNVSAPPASASVASKSASTTDGKTNSETVVATVANTGSIASASLAIPAGTTLRSASGALLSDPVTVSMASYDVSKAAGQKAMPGGFVFKNASGETFPLFVAAVANIEIKDANGASATQFDKPLSLRMDIPSTAINADKGRFYAPGDSMDAFSYSSSVGTWVSEGKSLVQRDSVGLYSVVSVSHLTTWMVGRASFDDKCNSPLIVNLPNLVGNNVSISATNSAFGIGRFVESAGQGQVQLDAVPVGYPMNLSVDFNGTNLYLARSTVFTCGDAVTVSSTLTVDVTSHTFGVKTVCDDGSGTPAATTGLAVNLFGANGLAASGTTNSAGEVSLSGLEVGATYDYVLSYKPKDFKGSIVANDGRTDVQIPVKCPKITGASGS
ncbi:MAG: hypothetical protein RL318_488 [Fibrobacterota bacterium]|jgi:hypothetical protein